MVFTEFNQQYMTKSGIIHTAEKRRFKGAAEIPHPFYTLKFIADAIDAFHIVRQVGGQPGASFAGCLCGC